MKDLITWQHKHLIWQDEIRDTFLLLKHCEIFKYSDTVIGVYCWSYSFATRIKKNIPVLDEFTTDDIIYGFHISVEFLPLLIDWGQFKRRPHKSGTFIQAKEKLLGHKILPYQMADTRPKYLKNLKPKQLG